MKTKKIELDVDFIGGQGPLTSTEEKELSDFFKRRKMASQRSIAEKKIRRVKRSKISS
ncbi:MAG: hypothetical protein IPO83_15340 [Chitinophagaceae bacterium]|nr:hypothetical protein [Chitinophagaceae bacterium]